MKILIDIQAIQTVSRTRGIGNYTRNFIKSILASEPNHDIVLLINENLHLPKDIIRQFLGTYPNLRAIFWKPLQGIHLGSDAPLEHVLKKRKISREIYSETVKRSSADILLICSGFEGYLEDAIYSADIDLEAIMVYIIGYDTIPFATGKTHFSKFRNFELHLEDNLMELKKASTILSISESTTKNFKEFIIEMNQKILTIFGGVSSEQLITRPSKTENGMRKSSSILLIGNSEHHKNIAFVLRTIADCGDPELEDLEIELIGHFDEDFRKINKKVISKLEKSQRLTVQTNISESDKSELIRNASVVILPSLEEGLNLVLIEAIQLDIPILPSDIPIHREVLIDCGIPAFNPESQADFLEKLKMALSSPQKFRISAEKYKEFVQKMSYNNSAIAFFSDFRKYSEPTKLSISSKDLRRKKLALVSPLPPSQTGVADYAQEQICILLDNLGIEVTVVQELKYLENSKIEQLPKLTPDEFKSQYERFDYVFYHLGNSHFHDYMLELLRDYPGIVFMHDVDFSGWFMLHENSNPKEARYSRSIWAEYGLWSMVAKKIEAENQKQKRIIGFEFIKNSVALVVHNRQAYDLLQTSLPSFTEKMHIIPLPNRYFDLNLSPQSLKKSLGIDEGALVICSFGMMAETKCDLEIVKSFLTAVEISGQNAVLVFVGQTEGAQYGTKILEASRENENIIFTSRVSPDKYRDYLQVCDVAIQLRSESKGETSGALLDVLAIGIPTIANMHGSIFSDLGPAVFQIPDNFTEEQLTKAILELIVDKDKRNYYSKKGQEYLEVYNSRTLVSHKLSQLLAGAELKNRITKIKYPHLVLFNNHNFIECLSGDEILQLAKSVRRVQGSTRRVQRVYIDVTASFYSISITGIERTVRELFFALYRNYSEIIEVIPVRILHQDEHMYFTCLSWGLTECIGNSVEVEDYLVTFDDGDKLIIADFSGHHLVQAEKESDLLSRINLLGVEVCTVIYDILPVSHAEYFTEYVQEVFKEWIAIIHSVANKLISISETTLKELNSFSNLIGRDNNRHIVKYIMPLGSSFVFSPDANYSMDDYGTVKFLMVGTIEPRKGYLEVLQVFENLINIGLPISLTIVGREGWIGVSTNERREIINILAKIKELQNRGMQIFWENSADDDQLSAFYRISNYYIAASYAEGFGLPLIEAASFNLPIIARKIGIFEEVLGVGAMYFSTYGDSKLEDVITRIVSDSNFKIEKPNVTVHNWDEVASQFIYLVLSKDS